MAGVGGGAERGVRETQADSLLSREPDMGFNLRTSRSDLS